MHVGLKLGIAATVGAAIGTSAGSFADEPNVGGGLALMSAGTGIAGLFAASVLRGVPNPAIGFVGVGAGAMIAAAGMQQLFASPDRVDVSHTITESNSPFRHFIESGPMTERTHTLLD